MGGDSTSDGLMVWADGGYPLEHRDFARIWQKAQKIVFARSLTGAPTRSTHVERDFDFEAIRKLKRESEHDHQHWRRRACGGLRSKPISLTSGTGFSIR